MGCFKNSQRVRHVYAGSHSQPADLSCQRVGEVVAVQIGGSKNAVLFGMKQSFLEHGVRYPVPDDHFSSAVFGSRFFFQNDGIAEFLRRFISPGAEAAFREFHDIAFMHQSNAGQAVGKRVADGSTDKPFGAFFRHGFYADCRFPVDLCAEFRS